MAGGSGPCSTFVFTNDSRNGDHAVGTSDHGASSGAAFGVANLFWTLLEVIGACILVLALGPRGLAWSYAFVVWIGLWLLMASLHRNTGGLMRNLAREIVVRPSVICAAGSTVAVTLLARTFHLPARESWLIYAVAGTVILSSYLLEPELRGFLVHGET